MDVPKVFEVRDVPPRFVVRLEGSRLFSTDGDHVSHSEDSGRTWSEPVQACRKGGSPLEGKFQSVKLLSSGKLGGICRRYDEALRERFPHRSWPDMFFVTSDDGGLTWSTGIRVGAPGDVLQGVRNSLIQLGSGRLILPVDWDVADYAHPEYRGEGEGHSFRGGYGWFQGRRMLVEGHDHTPEFYGTIVYYSDDLGQSWRSSPNNLWVWPIPPGKNCSDHSPMGEGVIVETDDDRLLMLCRTVTGRHYECLSEDGGVQWSIPYPTDLAASGSPCYVARIPSTSDLVVVWNQVSAEEIQRGLKRSRMSVAISEDKGRTWIKHKTLEVTALPDVEKIDPPPIGHYHSLEDVGEIPKDFGCFDYPNIEFVDDLILFSYNVHTLHPESGWTENISILGARDMYSKLVALPVSWLYEPGGENG